MKVFAASAISVAIGGAVLCPICEPSAAALTVSAVSAMQAADTATARLHISGMTCGTCPVTARKALGKVPGVYSATVTLDDSLGVVRFDPRKVTPAQIAAQLSKLTGYGTKVLADTVKAPARRGA
ncbi:MAG: heavy-metal-associated domain-containing protein [Gemmatimonadota bacterium]|nr:heavy-metal-associated domain-containing protein [Gemmatimonadota bacterium]